MTIRKLLQLELWSIPLWITFGLVNGTQVVVGMRSQGMHHLWFRLFVVYALSWSLWAVVSPLVLLLAARFPVRRYWPMHVAAYLAIGISNAVWIVLLDYYFQPMGPGYRVYGVKTVLGFFYSKFHLDLLAYAGLLAIGQMLESRETLAERDEQLSRAKLDALRQQLQPHFLFNTLNGIAGLVRIGENKTAVDMIAGLSDLLRRVVDGRAGADASLSEEIDFVHKYLELQKMRFSDRLHADFDVPAELSSVRVPSMILQPLVENALEHGIGKLVQGGRIAITARRAESALILTITNDGMLLARIDEGIGIANTRARLRRMYGSTAGFTIHNTPAGFVEAIVTVPLHD
jgi:two-component system LytT family sensor kinase